MTASDAFSWPLQQREYSSALDGAEHQARRRNSSPAEMSWFTRIFARSPRAIAAKREELLLRSGGRGSKSKSSSRASSAERCCADSSSTFSLDLESQASTLLEEKTWQDKLQEKQQRRRPFKIDARVVSDAIIGLSDGLTVPFALTAGLSAMGSTKVVIFAGLAELTAGAISMGLGGYLAAQSEEESQRASLAETRALVARSARETRAAVEDAFAGYDLSPALVAELSEQLSRAPQQHAVRFLMRFQDGGGDSAAVEASSRALTCALTIAAGYFVGGFVPLVPYFIVARDQVAHALYWSFACMAVSLFAFGYSKTCFVSGWSGRGNVWRGAAGGVQMMAVGGTAAICAMMLVRLFDSLAE